MLWVFLNIKLEEIKFEKTLEKEHPVHESWRLKTRQKGERHYRG